MDANINYRKILKYINPRHFEYEYTQSDREGKLILFHGLYLTEWFILTFLPTVGVTRKATRQFVPMMRPKTVALAPLL